MTYQSPEISRFTVSLDGWTPEFTVIPIRSHESGIVIGGATIIAGPIWKCFVAKNGYYESLRLDLGDKSYISPVFSEEYGSIIGLTLSCFSLGEFTKEITLSEEDSDES